MSKQADWQRKQIAAGNCGICGKPRAHYPQRCDDCQAEAIERQRALQGARPWRPGGRGRPPKTR